MSFFGTKITALLLAAGMVFTVSGQNLIENADFENGVSEWVLPSWGLNAGKEWLRPAADKSNSQGAGGTASMRLDWTSKHICLLNYVKEITLPKTEELELSFWTKNSGYKGINQVGIEVVFPEVQDKTKKRVSHLSPWNRSPKEWTYYQKRFKVPENVTKARLSIRIHGYKNEKGTTWLDNLYFGPVQEKTTEKVAPKVVLSRGISVSDHGGVYYPGEEIVYSFELKDNRLPGGKSDFSWRIEDFDGAKIAEGEQKVTLPDAAAGAFQVKLSVPKESLGWFAIKGRLSENGKTLSEVTSAFFIVEKQKGPRDPFFTAKGPGSLEKQIRMGNGSMFIYLQRRFIQTGPDSYRMPKQEQLVELALKNGFEPFFTFLISQKSSPVNPQQPPFLRKKVDSKLAQGIDPYDAEYYQTWRNFFAMLAAKYKGKVRDWYIGDEIYNTYHQSKYELPHYIQVQKILYEEVKKQDPASMIGGCGTFMDKDPVGRKLWRELKNYMDGLSCSLYLGQGAIGKGLKVDDPESGRLVERFKITRSVIGDKQFISGTESGFCFMDFPEIDSAMVKEIAKINARNLVILKAMKVRKWTYFQFVNDPSLETKKWGYGRIDYGMWNRTTGCPKPHAAAWAVSARALAFATDPVDASPCPDVYCYVFRKGNKTLAAFWAYTKEDIDARIDLPAAWSGVDFLGRPVQGNAGPQNFKLKDRVLYLEFDAPQDAVVKAFRSGKYVLPEVCISLNRIDGGKVAVYLKNKAAGDLAANVKLNSLPERKVVVKKGETARIPFACPPGNGQLSASAVVNGIRYGAAKKDEWYGVEKLSAPPSIQNGVLKGFENVKPLVMDSLKHLMPSEIETHGIWTGKEDLSARVYTGYDKDYFYLGVDVTDDTHVSRYSGMNAWNQDSVEFAFDTDNNAFDAALSPDGYAADDRDFVMSLTPQQKPELFCYTGSPDIERKALEQPQIVRTGNRTVYLARLPWSALGNLKPVPGSVFGFNVVVIDFDRQDARVPCQMEFSPGITYGKRPHAFKRFILK